MKQGCAPLSDTPISKAESHFQAQKPAVAPGRQVTCVFPTSSGLHSVADIYCECCDTYLGWKYEQAFESSQKYKEGKYIIELAHLIKDNGWNLSPMDLSLH